MAGHLGVSPWPSASDAGMYHTDLQGAESRTLLSNGPRGDSRRPPNRLRGRTSSLMRRLPWPIRRHPDTALRSCSGAIASIGPTGGTMERHGSESYFVIGEGLLGETVGGRDRTLAPADEALVPPFRFSRMGPSGAGRQLPEPSRREVVGGDRRGRRRRVPDPGRVHVSRPVRRPRPDVRQDERDARRGRLPCRAPPGALAQPRPRLALRSRSGRIRHRRSSTRRTAST